MAAIQFTEPFVRPGIPEAHRHGCTCRFEPNLNAAIIAADRAKGTTILVIHEDCPLHKLIPLPPDPEFG